MTRTTDKASACSRRLWSRCCDPVLENRLGLSALELLVVRLPQVESFRSALGEREERRALLVRWYDDEGGWGIGECSCRPDPYFNGEYLEGAAEVIERFVFPRLPSVATLREHWQALLKVRGWPFTVAAVLDAALDCLRRQGLPDPVDRWPARRLEKIPAGISLGLFADADQAVARARDALVDGYRRIKLKVMPGMDLGPLRAVREAAPHLPLAFDANGSCGEGDGELLRALAELDPLLVEQPFDPQRLDLHQRLRRELPGLRLCLDESVRGLGDLWAAAQLNALDELNLKPGRVGGAFAAIEMLGLCDELGLPCWIGGMFESGVGRRSNLRYASTRLDATAHDLSPSRRYFVEEVVAAPVEMATDGLIEAGEDQPVELALEVLERRLERRLLLEKPS